MGGESGDAGRPVQRRNKRIDGRDHGPGYVDPVAFAALLRGSTAQPEPQATNGSTSGEAAVPPATVVVIDDRVEVQELLGVRLGMVAGLRLVGKGFNGADAMALARTLAPDVMILDLQMPVMTGVEAIPLLRALVPRMRIVVYTSDARDADLTGGNRPDAVVLKGANLGDLVAVLLRLVADKPTDLVEVNLGLIPVQVAVDAFDSWVGLNARVRHALATKGDLSAELLGDVLPLDSSEMLCLMGVFMQFGMPLMMASAAGEEVVNLRFSVHREAGAAARRALLALGGNGTLRAFNRAWSHRPTKQAEDALELVDKRLVEQLPVS